VPALAVADELRARGVEVSFIGARSRVGTELVPASGYELFELSVRGLDRRHPGRAAVAVVQGLRSVARAFRLLGRLKPDAVLATGGYVGGPVGLAAIVRRTPLVLSESDSRLGLSNRLLAPFARRVFLAFSIPGLTGRRYRVTGRPVPKAILNADRERARRRLGLGEGEFSILVFGGSQGARSLNVCALEALARRTPPNAGGGVPVVLHVAGRRDYPELAKGLAEAGSPSHYRLYEYFETLADPLAAADLVVARAGASLFELAAAGKPAVLVPLPHATGAHQLKNARWMADGGAAVVILDEELEPDRLRRTIEDLMLDTGRLQAMATAARRLARPEAAGEVASELIALTRRKAEPAKTAKTTGTVRATREEAWLGRRLHFVGIGGAGMSALALVAQRLGAEVSGCDRAEGAYTRVLEDAGIEPEIGHSPAHVEDGVELVVSTAVSKEEPEIRVARERGTPILHRGTLLAELSSLRRLIAVAGTHGKTTTAAMAAHCLVACGLEPSYLIGGQLQSGGATSPVPHAGWGAGEWLVAEADESDRSFLELSPEIAVVTNMELDHHTTYGSSIELEDAFRSFLERVPEGGAVVLWDHPALVSLGRDGRRTVTYGIEETPDGRLPRRAPDLLARNVRQAGLGTRFELARAGHPLAEVELSVPGRHNVLNALGALAASELVGAELGQAAEALETFRGATRRFEKIGEPGGVQIFDDYAHHPTEVAATLEAARALEPSRLIAVFQPHLYSRTLYMHKELGRALAEADVVVVLEVYPARERPEGALSGVTGKLVADACADSAGGRPVWWLPTVGEAEEVLEGQVSEGDLVVTIGAGDVDRLARRLAERVAARAGEREAAAR